jgi:uncharacterized membrane protein
MSGSERAGALRLALIWGVRALLGALALAPFVPLIARSAPGLSGLASGLERWFSFQCQRDPSRALRFWGQPLAVCARCSGLYWGFGLGALVAWPRLRAGRLRAWVLAASLLMVLDVATEAFALRPAWAPLRVLSGALLAYPVGVALVCVARARLTGDRARSEAVFDAE